MILVDTSVWIDHLHKTDATLGRLLEDQQVVMHPFVFGELACGRVKRRTEFLDLLSDLPPSPILSHEEALGFLERRRLTARGISWIDVHLLGSAMLADAGVLWTRDKRLLAIASELRIAF